jgi:hypothetical protein
MQPIPTKEEAEPDYLAQDMLFAIFINRVYFSLSLLKLQCSYNNPDGQLTGEEFSEGSITVPMFSTKERLLFLNTETSRLQHYLLTLKQPLRWIEALCSALSRKNIFEAWLITEILAESCTPSEVTVDDQNQVQQEYDYGTETLILCSKQMVSISDGIGEEISFFDSNACSGNFALTAQRFEDALLMHTMTLRKVIDVEYSDNLINNRVSFNLMQLFPDLLDDKSFIQNNVNSPDKHLQMNDFASSSQQETSQAINSRKRMVDELRMSVLRLCVTITDPIRRIESNCRFINYENSLQSILGHIMQSLTELESFRLIASSSSHSSSSYTEEELVSLLQLASNLLQVSDEESVFRLCLTPISSLLFAPSNVNNERIPDVCVAEELGKCLSTAAAVFLEDLFSTDYLHDRLKPEANEPHTPEAADINVKNNVSTDYLHDRLKPEANEPHTPEAADINVKNNVSNSCTSAHHSDSIDTFAKEVTTSTMTQLVISTHLSFLLHALLCRPGTISVSRRQIEVFTHVTRGLPKTNLWLAVRCLTAYVSLLTASRDTSREAKEAISRCLAAVSDLQNLQHFVSVSSEIAVCQNDDGGDNDENDVLDKEAEAPLKRIKAEIDCTTELSRNTFESISIIRATNVAVEECAYEATETVFVRRKIRTFSAQSPLSLNEVITTSSVIADNSEKLFTMDEENLSSSEPTSNVAQSTIQQSRSILNMTKPLRADNSEKLFTMDEENLSSSEPTSNVAQSTIQQSRSILNMTKPLRADRPRFSQTPPSIPDAVPHFTLPVADKKVMPTTQQASGWRSKRKFATEAK